MLISGQGQYFPLEKGVLFMTMKQFIFIQQFFADYFDWQKAFLFLKWVFLFQELGGAFETPIMIINIIIIIIII